MLYGILMIVVSVAIMVGASYWANTNQWDDIRKFLCTVVQLMAIGPLIAGVMMVFQRPAEKPATEPVVGASMAPGSTRKPRQVVSQPSPPRFTPQSEASKKAQEAATQKEIETREQSSPATPDVSAGQTTQPDQASTNDSAPAASSAPETPPASGAPEKPSEGGPLPASAPTSP